MPGFSLWREAVRQGMARGSPGGVGWTLSCLCHFSPGRSGRGKGPRPSSKGPTAEPWSLLLSSALHKLSTSWASRNSCWTCSPSTGPSPGLAACALPPCAALDSSPCSPSVSIDVRATAQRVRAGTRRDPVPRWANGGGRESLLCCRLEPAPHAPSTDNT